MRMTVFMGFSDGNVTDFLVNKHVRPLLPRSRASKERIRPGETSNCDPWPG
jgi:hypothetical protein